MSTSPRRWAHSVGGVILFVGMLLALLHGLMLNTGPGSPLREMRDGTSQQLLMERKMGDAVRWFTEAADGRNLALHFAGFSSDDPLLGRLMAQFYYRAAYELYPRRVIVGGGDRVINVPADMEAADVPRDDAWLRQHDVRAVLNIQRTAEGSLDVESRRVE